MDPAIAVLLAIIVVLIPLAIKAFKDTHTRCDRINNRVTIVETKLDIYLNHAGFDINKINRAIKENIEELQQGDSLSIGCIDVKDLYREKES